MKNSVIINCNNLNCVWRTVNVKKKNKTFPYILFYIDIEYLNISESFLLITIYLLSFIKKYIKRCCETTKDIYLWPVSHYYGLLKKVIFNFLIIDVFT